MDAMKDKTRKFRSLRSKIGWTLGLIMIATAAVLITYTSLTARQKAVEAAREHALASARDYGNIIAKDIEEGINISKALAQSFSAIRDNENPVDINRLQANSLLSQIIIQNPAFYGVSMAWEPNAFDGQDALHISVDSLHGESGRYAPYIFKENGRLIGEETVIKENSNYYNIPRNTHKETIIDPQSYTVNNESISLITITAPILHNNQFLGIAGVDISTDWMQSLVKDNMLYDGKATISVISNNGTIAATTLADSLLGKRYNKIFPEREVQFANLVDGKEGQEMDSTSLRVFSPMYLGDTETPWQVSVSVPEEIIFQEANAQMRNMIIISVLLLIIGLYTVIWMINRLVKPLTNMVSITRDLGLGKITRDKVYTKNDEIGLMNEALSNLREGLQKTSDFAYQIGKGNLEADYNALSEHDTLGNSLLSMRNSLKQVAAEDKKRSWVNQGLATFGELLRNNSADVNELSKLTLARIVQYLEINQGCIYLMNSEDEEQPYLNLASTYAWQKHKIRKGRIEIGEGLAGQAVQERDTLYYTDIPNNHVKITSGLGQANPTSILIVPLMVNEEVVGVIELASFKEIDDYRREFVEKIAESLAATLITARNNQVTRELLEESRLIAEEKRAAEEELMQNQEELQATTEEMQRTIDALKQENAALQSSVSV